MTIHSPTPSFAPTCSRLATVALCLGLGACTTVGDWFSSDRVDYHGAAKRTQPLEVPPDLTQLQRDSRYLPQSGVITASDLQKPGTPPTATASADAGTTPTVALNSAGDLRIERQGSTRWLIAKQAPEQLWPRVKEFWLARGFTLMEDNPQTGILQTNWAENSAKLPQGFIHNMLGKVLDGIFDSGLRDRYRTRLERSADGGTEIFITHFGATEQVSGLEKSDMAWVPRPSDPGLEAQMLSALLLSLGGVDANAQTLAANASRPGAPAASSPTAAPSSSSVTASRARVLAGQPGATLQVDDTFDRAWRRIGLALDHGGFTVEDRDRAQGLYYVRFVDAKEAARDEPGVLSKMTSWFGKNPPSPVGKYRILIKANAEQSTAMVLNDQGQPDNSENGQRIVALLADELR